MELSSDRAADVVELELACGNVCLTGTACRLFCETGTMTIRRILNVKINKRTFTEVGPFRTDGPSSFDGG
jgi:hypothetical protein